MSDSPPATKRFSIQFKPEISFGQLIYIIVTLVPLIGGGAWVLTGYVNRIENTQASVTAMRLDVGARFDAMQANVNRQFNDVQIAIAALPDFRAELGQLERRVNQSDDRASAQSARLDQLQQATASNTARLENMMGGPAPAQARKTP